MGVFVSPAGSDSAAGTMMAPLKTIGGAIARAMLGPKRVYACVGAYGEPLSRGGVLTRMDIILSKPSLADVA